MDELVGIPTASITPVERARNRLAIALFSVCLAVVAIALLVEQPSRVHQAEVLVLSKQAEHWSAVERRRIALEGNPHIFFADTLSRLLREVCIESDALKRAQQQYRSELPANKAKDYGFTYYDYTYTPYRRQPRNKELPARCEPRFSSFGLVLADVDSAADALAALRKSADGRPTLGAVIKTLNTTLSATSRGLLKSAYGEDKLAALIREWWTWPIQRTWLVAGEVEYTSGGYAEWFTTATVFAPRRNSSRRVGDRLKYFDQDDADDSINRSRLTSSRSIAEARAVIDSARAVISHRLTAKSGAHSGQVQMAGVSVGLAPALELSVPVIAILMSIFVIFFVRAQRPVRARSRAGGTAVASGFWFPRFSSPADPLAAPLPRTVEEWFARTLWATFLALPLGLVFYGAWTGMVWENLSQVDSRFGGNGAVNWVAASCLLLVWISLIRITEHSNAPPKETRNWLPVTMTGLVTVFFVGGALLGGWRDFEVIDWEPWTSRSAPPVTTANLLEPLTYPSCWIASAIWLYLATRRPTACRFAIVCAFILTVSTFLGLGRATLETWRLAL